MKIIATDYYGNILAEVEITETSKFEVDEYGFIKVINEHKDAEVKS